MTEQWTDEYLLLEELDNIIVDWLYGARITSGLQMRIHELYKKYTYLKGNKELPEFDYAKHLMFAEDVAFVQNGMLESGFKSTEEWKK